MQITKLEKKAIFKYCCLILSAEVVQQKYIWNMFDSQPALGLSWMGSHQEAGRV